MLRALLALLQKQGGLVGYTVPSLATTLGVTPDEVRLGLLQLERLGLVRQWPCPEAGPTTTSHCAGCPVAAACRPASTMPATVRWQPERERVRAAVSADRAGGQE